jgi:tetratricopeptide (TPR) repeat protein
LFVPAFDRSIAGMLRSVLLVVALVAGPGAWAQGADAPAAGRERTEAIAGLTDAAIARRVESVVWLARNGTAADDVHLYPRLTDVDPRVRDLAERVLWVLWSRSGDAEVDALMERGQDEVASRDFDAAVATYSEVIRRKPAFAEGWNKRATVHYLAGDLTRSLADCDEVMKRKPRHFGALSGYGQIYFQQERYDKAIEFWRRALEANPNMEGLEANIETAERLRARLRRDQV